MDARRQKRLGPAPIASFEKSFEDNTTAATPATAATAATATAAAQQQQKRTAMMEQTLRKQQTTTAPRSAHPNGGDASVALPNTGNRAGSSNSSSGGGGGSGGGGSSSSTSNSSQSTSTATCSANVSSIVAKQRPPPLKTATATVTTTLVSSNEGGQPLGVVPASVGATYRGAATLTTPSTPRIELSRASSSSHHEEDSRESSPENVFEQVGTGTLQETIGLGFREEGALELRSSTEELYFMDPEQKKEEQERMQQQQQQQQQQGKRSSPHIFKFDEHQSYLQQHQRKDSASSEVAALLCISGRTSRISSVGSQGSAVSRLSAVSCVSRSPSPHRMLLETSFCGPKPVEGGADAAAALSGASNASTAPSSAQSLGEATSLAVEQLLLARAKHDPTQVVLAEGIQMQPPAGSAAPPARRSKPNALANGDSGAGSRPAAANSSSGSSSSSKPIPMGGQRRSTKSPGQMVVGKTPSGTEYIRINLRPDHMYSDKGIAANERIVEAPNQLAPVYSKPVSLSLQGAAGAGLDDHRLTPTASPKPSRHGLRLTSRSPSPAAAAGVGVGVSVSRKSSFSSLFRLGKDSPDSPRESSRSRSKSKERPATAMAMGTGAPGSQNVTPSKQKSVLAIFKPGKRGSSAGTDGTKSSKSSSPIGDCAEPPPPPPPVPGAGRSRTPAGSRPNSRLRYYDEPVEGVIHIPLHTPPEEREARTLLQGIQQLAAPSPPPVERPRIGLPPPGQHITGNSSTPAPAGAGAPITASQLAAAAAALRPVGQRKPAAAGAKPRPDPNAIQKLPSQEEPEELLEHQQGQQPGQVQRHSSQESQETQPSIISVLSARAANLAQVSEHTVDVVVRENGLGEMPRLPSVDSTQSACEPRLVQTVATVNAPVEDAAAKERRRLLFATRLGSGSQEQLFSTQFSISKTESQSSQLSEQVQLPDSGSTASDCTTDGLQRQGTVIRRADVVVAVQATARSSSEEEQTPQQPQPQQQQPNPPPPAAVVMRVKPKSEEEPQPAVSVATPPGAPLASDVRHSRYLESFDVRRKYHENVTESVPEGVAVAAAAPGVPRKPKRQSVPEVKAVAVLAEPQSSELEASVSPTPTQEERSERHSTDEHEPIESSESERDSDMAGSSSMATAVPMGADAKRHHFPRNVCLIEEHESTGLVSQESFDDELPYVPTTLPEERAQGVPLIPMKERANMELKTCPVDRPRSTTPLNPSHLEEYCTGIMTPQDSPHVGHELDAARAEKLRICLPRKESAIKDKAQCTSSSSTTSKSPRRISNASGKSWFEFAEEGLRANNLERKDSSKQLLPPPPPPPAPAQAQGQAAAATAAASGSSANLEEPRPKASTQRKLSGHWIDFENIPEKRKPAKRITTLPKETITTTTTAAITSAASAPSVNRTASHSHAHHHGHAHHHQRGGQECGSGDKLHYNYVKPEDCQCECHEAERGESSAATNTTASTTNTADKDKDTSTATGTGTGTGTGSDSRASVELLAQGEDTLPLLEPEPQAEIRGVYATETQRASASGRHGSRSMDHRSEEFPRRDASASSRNRKFPDRK